jgi:hypothetical protein
MSVTQTRKLVPSARNIPMLNARKACVGYGHSGECFLLGYRCQIAMEKYARLATDENA